MPVYDYKCDKCGTTRTQTVNIKTDDFKAVCSCGTIMRKIIGAPTIKFKGTGWGHQ